MTENNTAEWSQRYAKKVTTPQQAVADIQTGNRVFVGSGAAEPQSLVEALSARDDLTDTEIVHILTLGMAAYTRPAVADRFRHTAYFIGGNVRDAVNEGRADYTPIFLSELPHLFRNGRIRIDTALIAVSPPDRHGYCSYGVSTDVVKAAAESARCVVAEVNENMPRALGDCFIHIDRISHMVPSNRALPELRRPVPGELAQRIARHVARLIDDGATLQLGIGAIPDAVLGYLSHCRNLGVHTEMFSDGLIPLFEQGVINNNAKTLNRGKIVTSFVMGTRTVYDFVDNNPAVEMRPTEYVNDPTIIAQHDKMVAINGAIEVDLTGQVCSDSVGTRFYSGIGGQVDFIRGAARSRGGKPIIALSSSTKNDTISRIVPELRPGAGVVTSRGDVHYVVTEYGAAYLHGRSVRERALALIQIAHPAFRESLLNEARNRRLIPEDVISLPVTRAIYPEELERWITLKDGRRAFMRPLRVSDEAALRDLFYRLSPETIHSRFFEELKTLPRDQLREWLNIDYENDMALVVLTDDDENGRLVGMATYRQNPRTNFADAAFLIEDLWQSLGIGTAMMKSLADTARQHGITGFTADVLVRNQGMMRIFHKCGRDVESRLEQGVYSLKVPFDDPPVAS